MYFVITFSLNLLEKLIYFKIIVKLKKLIYKFMKSEESNKLV